MTAPDFALERKRRSVGTAWMRERLLSFLEKIKGPVPASRVLWEVLKVRSPNEITANRVLQGIVGRDKRFRNVRGLWSVRAAARCTSPAGLGRTASLYLETGALPGHVRGAIHQPEAGAHWEFEVGGEAPYGGFRSLRTARTRLEEGLLLAWSPKELRTWNRLLTRFQLREWNGASICLRDLAARILERSPHGLRLEDVASRLELPIPDAAERVSMAVLMSSCFEMMLDRVPLQDRSDPEALQAWINAGKPKVDFSRFGFGPELLGTFPAVPGVYLMRNRAKDIIYVGKSRNLKRRVRSYFTARALRDPKAARIHERLYSVEVIVTGSEVEALLLEMRLIRDFKPPINLQTEVHEQHNTYGKQEDLLLLVPHSGEEKAEIYFLRAGTFVAQLPAALGRRPSRQLREKIRSVYFSERLVGRPHSQPWELELVLRWLAANRRRLNYLDIDEAGDFPTVVKRLSLYLNDPGKLLEKVYYR